MTSYSDSEALQGLRNWASQQKAWWSHSWWSAGPCRRSLVETRCCGGRKRTLAKAFFRGYQMLSDQSSSWHFHLLPCQVTTLNWVIVFTLQTYNDRRVLSGNRVSHGNFHGIFPWICPSQGGFFTPGSEPGNAKPGTTPRRVTWSSAAPPSWIGGLHRDRSQTPRLFLSSAACAMVNKNMGYSL